jgi:hypothetical protein
MHDSTELVEVCFDLPPTDVSDRSLLEDVPEAEIIFRPSTKTL